MCECECVLPDKYFAPDTRPLSSAARSEDRAGGNPGRGCSAFVTMATGQCYSGLLLSSAVRESVWCVRESVWCVRERVGGTNYRGAAIV